MAMAKVTGVTLLREMDSPYIRVQDGYENARVVYHADLNTFGGGWARMISPSGSKDDETKYGTRDYAIKYDMVLFVVNGEVELTAAGETTFAKPGEGILIAKGTVITLLGKPGTVFFYVLQPINWAEVGFRTLGPVAEEFMRRALAAGMTKQTLAAEMGTILGFEQKRGREALLWALTRAATSGRFRAEDVRSLIDQA